MSGLARAPRRAATRREYRSSSVAVGSRLFRHRGAQIGSMMLIAIVLLAVLAPIIAPYDPLSVSLSRRLLAPSAEHWFGTDALGRDVLSRVLFGARYSLLVGVAAAGIGLAFGTPVGMIAGYFAGTRQDSIDSLLMRLMDILLAFPAFLLALMFVSALGPSLVNAMIAVGVVSIPRFARLARAGVLVVRERDFVTSARAAGGSESRVLFVHILPNAVHALIIQGTLGVAQAILTAAGLSFLGLGAQPPTPEWGAMLNAGRGLLERAPWVALFPGLAIMVAVLSINLLGDGLRDALDPRTVNA